MITDPLFYRLFETSPETFWLMLGLSAVDARAMVRRYQYLAPELKEVARRTDGVFQPADRALPVYFVEVQMFKSDSVYANILAKASVYLEHHDPAQPFFAVVLFAEPSLEPALGPSYQPLLDAGVLAARAERPDWHGDPAPDPPEGRATSGLGRSRLGGARSRRSQESGAAC
jgi:hypothetical protein